MKNKLNAAALLALSASLAACSSGGGSSSAPQSTPVVSANQKAAAEAAAKKLAAEKAAAEAAAKKAAEEAAKKLAAEKAAAEAAAKKAAEEAAKKAAAEKAAAEAAAKKAAEEAAKKAAAEKAAAEAAAKKAAEEAAKKAAEEAARKAAEAAALEAKMKPLIEKAQKVGFSDAEAKAYAVKNVALSDAVAEQNLKTEIEAKADRDRALRIPYVDGHVINGKVVAYDSSLKQSGADVAFKKAARKEYEASYHTNYDDLELDITPQTGYVVIDGKTVKQTRIGKEYIAYQPYSVVYGNLLTNVSVDGKAIVNPADKPYFRIDEIAGYAVTDATLPTEGKATYKLASSSLGNAGHVTVDDFNNGISVGSDFQYIVDFDGKSGHGNFTAWGYLAPGQSRYTKHMVTLDQGPLQKISIDNVTTYGVESSLSVKAQDGGV